MDILRVLLIAISVHAAVGSTTKDAHISTLNGPVVGTSKIIDGKLVWEFLAVPFAEPPLGSLRFRPPKPLTRTWTEPLQANTPPKGCLQMPMKYIIFEENIMPTYGEDCLYLNVWTPNVGKQAKKSVMIWIHGGGFLSGESLPIFNGNALAAIGDVIVVVIQYRVGYMGFARFDNELVPGNNGLRDQQMALKWVHENIEAFGGDPESVTIFGQSAGGSSAAYHLINEESGRYFKRAIMQSGSLGNDGWSFNPNVDALERLNRKMASKYLKCDQESAIELLRCLESKSEEELRIMITNHTRESREPFSSPTIDGHFLTRNPMEVLASGGINRKDTIIGLTELEGSQLIAFFGSMAAAAQNISGPIHQLFTPQFVNETINEILSYYPHYPHRISSAIREIIFLRSISHVDSTRGDYNAIRFAESIGAYIFYCTTHKFADAIRAVHENVYFYVMAHMPSQPVFQITDKWMKCTHGDDIPFIFALPLVYPEIRYMTDDELLLARRMIGDWTHFAKTGNPLDPNWRQFTLKDKGYYRYNLQSSFETGGIGRDECVFWDKILPMVNKLACQGDEQSRCDPNGSNNNEISEKKSKDEL